MFSSTERDALRDTLLAAARADDRLQGAAITGSASLGAEDRWSDIDLSFGLAKDADQAEVLSDWTARMYRDHSAVAHTDVRSRDSIYRVFLLADTLQVDIAFAPAAEFGALAPTFALVFGSAEPQPVPAPPDAANLVGMAWLYALHARSSLARGKPWQAEYLLSGMRERIMSLACLRLGLNPYQGRGVDSLPEEVTARMVGTLVGSVEPTALRRAFGVALEALIHEIEAVDSELAERLTPCLREIGEW